MYFYSQPGPGVRPVFIGGRCGYTQNSGGLFIGESRKIAQFDSIGLAIEGHPEFHAEGAVTEEGAERIIVLGGKLTLTPSTVEGGYTPPDGGWTYTFAGDAATAGPNNNFDSLDGTWDHDNGSDQWDGLGIGAGQPGGVMTLMEDTTDFLRMQDVFPRDPGAEPSLG